MPNIEYPRTVHDARRALQRAHERIGDLVLDQVRTPPHPLGVDNHLRVGDVGQRVKRRLADGVGRPQCQHEHHAEHDPCVLRRQLDETFDHGRYSLWPACGSAAGGTAAFGRLAGVAVLGWRAAMRMPSHAAGRPQPTL